MSTAEQTRSGASLPGRLDNVVEPTRLRGKRILVAEDEPAVRGMLRRMLEVHGCEVREAANGREAAEYAREGSVDLVITDLWMPEMNGVELIEALEAMGCPAEVIVLSAHLTPSSTDRLRGLGVFRILRKPLDLAALSDAVQAGIRSDRRGRLAGELAGSLRSLSARQAGGSGSGPSRRPTVLVADDDGGVRGLLREALSRAGYRVEEARDGEEAVEKALACHLDLIIMDLNMPRMSGREAVEKLHRASRDCFVTCITGECTQREIDAALRAGAASCFRKPLDLAALMSEVERLDLITVHRKRLAGWERTRKESSAHRNMSNRRGRRFRWLVASAVAVVAISAAAVPVVSAWVGAAGRAVRAATEKAGKAVDSVSRMEGYLQRDEARELGRGR